MPRTALGWLALPALTLLLATSALADAGHAESKSPAAAPKSAAAHDMSADEHATMSADDHGMTADEHATMGADEASGDHSAHSPAAAPAEPADEHSGHDAAPAKPADEHGAHDGAAQEAEDRPVGLVLAGFGAVNGLVLIAAAVLRRRPDAQKRLKTLARVRATPAKRTVFGPANTPETKA